MLIRINKKKSDERKVWYTGATRARKTLHLLRTDYKFNYPIGSDYLILCPGEK
jgi:hypothetical protein